MAEKTATQYLINTEEYDAGSSVLLEREGVPLSSDEIVAMAREAWPAFLSGLRARYGGRSDFNIQADVIQGMFIGMLGFREPGGGAVQVDFGDELRDLQDPGWRYRGSSS